MAGALARVLTDHIVTVSRKVAKQFGPYLATVLSRNPDGTLNVDDGIGGCRRVVAAANVRVGQKIVVGTEPQIGQITSLGQQQFDISPSTLACPDDQRPICQPVIGVPCQLPLDVPATPVNADVCAWISNQIPSWSARGTSNANTVVTAKAFKAQTFWNNFNPTAKKYQCDRSFAQFDVTPPPPGAAITAASMDIYVNSADATANASNTPNGGIYSALDLSIFFVRSSVVDLALVATSDVANVDPTALYGSKRIRDLIVAGYINVALDPGSAIDTGSIAYAILSLGGRVRIAMLIGNDYSNTAPTDQADVPISFSHRDLVRFGTAVGGGGGGVNPPIFHFSYGVGAEVLL